MGFRQRRVYHYAIRKTSLGVGSVVIGLLLSGLITPSETVLANEVSPETSLTEDTNEGTLTAELANLAETEERSAENTNSEPNPAFKEHKVNLALGASAQANDVETAYWGADKAIDGIVNPEANKREQSRWATNKGSDAKELTVTLPDVKTVEAFSINWERTNIKGFHIDVSLDGSQFNRVYSKTDDSYVREETKVVLANPVTAKHVKLIVDRYDGGDANWPSVSLYEFGVLGRERLENLAYGKSVTANASETATLTPDKVTDGNIATRWASNTGVNAKSIQVDLGETKAIASTVLEWERKNATDYTLSVSTDGTSWTPVKHLTTKPSDFTEVINFDRSYDARYLKVDIANFDPTAEGRTGQSVTWSTVSLYEIEVYAKPLLTEESLHERRLEDIAAELTLPPIQGDMGKWQLPQVPEGVTIEFIGADFEQIIDYDLTVYQPLVDTEVRVNYRLRRGNEVYETPEKTVLVSGKYRHDQADNAKLTVMPGLAEWKGHTGHFTVTESARIVVKSSDKDSLSYLAMSFQEDYQALTGRQIAIVYADHAEVGDFFFELNQNDKGLKEEGYLMTIGDVVKVEANHKTGAFWSTQTLLQVLSQDKDKIAKGIVRDYPKFKTRGFVLDVGRKPIELSVLKDMIKELSWYKFNDFQLHLNDNYIWVEEYQRDGNPYGAYSAFRLESDIKEGGNGGLNKADLTAKDVFYTKKDFRQLIDWASERGIKIVPEFDAPAHALAFTKVRPDLTMTNRRVRRWADHLEVSNPESLAFIKSVWDEYIDGGDKAVFANTDTIHLGVDEFEGNNEGFRAFTDALLKYAISKGKTPRFWGSLTAKKGKTPVLSEGVEMNIWSTDWGRPKEMYDKGYKLINTLDGPLYIVPGANYYNDYLNSEYLYNNWDVNRIANATIPVGSPKMLGAAFAIWNDMIDKRANGILSYDIYKRFSATLPVLALKMWGNNDFTSYDAFRSASAVVGKPVNHNPYHLVNSKTDVVAKFDFNLSNLEDVSGNNYDGVTLVNANYETGKEKQGLRLNGGESYLTLPFDRIGPNNSLSFSVKLDSDATGEQIVAENGRTAIKLSQKDTGKVGISIEGYDHSFDYTLPKGEWVDVQFLGFEGRTELYINGRLVDTLGKQATGGKLVSLTLPTAIIGSRTSAVKGLIDNLVIGKGQRGQAVPLDSSGFVVSSDNENADGTAHKAFDGDLSTIWHTQWQPNKRDLPATILVDMKEVKAFDGLTYIPRQTGDNGNITHYKMYTKVGENDAFTLLKEGTWSHDSQPKTVTFEPIKAQYLKIEVLGGKAGFGSAAEFILTKSDQTQDLYRLYEEGLAHRELAYSKDSLAVLSKALEASQAVLANGDASAEHIALAYTSLSEAIAGLTPSSEERPSVHIVVPKTAPTRDGLPEGKLPEGEDMAKQVFVPRTSPTVEPLPEASLSELLNEPLGYRIEEKEEVQVSREILPQTLYSRVEKNHDLPKTNAESGMFLTSLGGLLTSLGLIGYRRRR